MTKHVAPTKPIEAVPIIERNVEKPTIKQLQHLANAKVLRDTITVLKVDGWTVGSMGYGDRPHCVLGAMGKAAGIGEGDEGYVYAHVPAAQVLGNHLSANYACSSTVVKWNDGLVRCEDDVIGTLQHLAEQEEALARG